uniref:Uncharacterized protein n=1 Tax=Branchiostoma floridae TaxID=7739 RepID=C3ZT42_BRAFL|eukprot:XP_002588237.1 hypothetical protein BRAFLDRAFT_86683 [Branchiostoma floridae]
METIGRLLSTVTTPTDVHLTLRAELWADPMVKILSCWIPIALASFVVGGNILKEASLECFPVHLVSAVTVSANADNVNGSSAVAFVDPRMYSTQLDDFVNVKCGKQTSFDYLVFTMMLVAQSVFMFAPHQVLLSCAMR